MKVNVVKAWKDADYRASLTQEQLKEVESPVLSKVNADLVKGGDSTGGTGWIPTVSSDCCAAGCNHNCSTWNGFWGWGMDLA
jgi:mersacidin/lichenicidin family type 2 lantibiotic